MTESEKSYEKINAVSTFCREVIHWKTSKNMNSPQKATDTIMKAYLMVYTCVSSSDSRADQFDASQIVSDVILDYFFERVVPSIRSSILGPNFIQIYREMWQEYVIGIAHLRTIFLSEDISWSNLMSRDKEKQSVEVLAMKLWRDNIFDFSLQLDNLEERYSVVSVLQRDVSKLFAEYRNYESEMENLEELIQTESPTRTKYIDRMKVVTDHLAYLGSMISSLRDDLKMLPDTSPSALFMNEYLIQMREWFESKCGTASKLNIQHYTALVFACLEREQRRAGLLFSDEHTVVMQLMDTACSHVPSNITEDTLLNWMENLDERGEELQSLSKLYFLVDDHGGYVGDCFKKYAATKIYELIRGTMSLLSWKGNGKESARNRELVCDKILIDLSAAIGYLHRIVTEAFFQAPTMQCAIEEALKNGATDWKAADLSGIVERLAVMTHHMVLRTQTSGLQSSPHTKLNRRDIISIFYVLHTLGSFDEKFLLEHQRLLAKRLFLLFSECMESRYSPEDVETRRKQQCDEERALLKDFLSITSHVTIFHCERMISSISSGNSLAVGVNNHSLTVKNGYDTQFSVQSRVVPSGSWPCTPEEMPLRCIPMLQKETRKSIDYLSQFYQGRQLKLCPEHTSGVVRMRFLNSSTAGGTSLSYGRFHVSLMQMSILVCFNQQKVWKVQQLQNSTCCDGPTIDFFAGLTALCNFGVLEPEGESVRVGDVRRVHSKLVGMERGEHIVSLIPDFATSSFLWDNEGKKLEHNGFSSPTLTETHHCCLEQQLMARVVQCLKADGRLNFEQLSVAMNRNTNSVFPAVENPTLKSILGKLLERGHLKREKGENDSFFTFVA